MSIPNMVNKIKSKIDVDKTTILFLLIIIGVGISSFALGRFSILNNVRAENIVANSQVQNRLEIGDNYNSNLTGQAQSIKIGEKRYVASKNGKMYYSLGCSGAKRIKPENEVWFNSQIDAEKSGYVLSSTCK